MQQTQMQFVTGTYRCYLWQQGDTLTAVAQAAGSTPQSIQALNPAVNFDAVPPGTQLCIPPESTAQTEASATQAQEADAADTPAQPAMDAADAPAQPAMDAADASAPAARTLARGTPVVTYPAIDTLPTGPYDPVYDGSASDHFFVDTPVTLPGVTVPGISSPSVSVPGVTVTITPGAACPVGYQARTVQAGQTYADLLIDGNISYQAMQESNPTLNPSRLVAGTRYCAPPGGTRQLCSRYSTYRMRDGETLAIAAQRLGTTVGRLLMLNPTMVPTDFSSGALICVPSGRS